MDKIIELIGKDVKLYHTKTDRMPNFYTFKQKIVEKYIDEDPLSNRLFCVYKPSRDLRAINLAKPEFITELIYRILKKDWFYIRPFDTYFILESLGLYDSNKVKPHIQINPDFHYNNSYVMENCDKIIDEKKQTGNISDLEILVWNVAKTLNEMGYTIQRNSVKELDYKLFDLLTELFNLAKYNLDGFCNKITLPSKIRCGMHHTELFIHNPTIVTITDTIQLGGRPGGENNIMYMDFTTGNDKHDAMLHPMFKTGKMRIARYSTLCD
jgi:hypothetical protein